MKEVKDDFELNVVIWNFGLSCMKSILRIGEFKFGKKTDDFVYYKRQVMDAFYGGLKRLFESAEMFSKCECNSNMRQGWGDACKICYGSGFKMKSKK